MGYRRAPHAAWRTIAGETIVVDLERKVMFGLDEAGGALWEVADESGRLEALLARQGSSAGSREELERFLAELLELGLLEPAAAPLPVATSTPEVMLNAPPRILWREPIQKVAATCGFLPAQSPLCTQAPFS